MKLTLAQKRQIVRDEIKAVTEAWRVAKRYPKILTKAAKPLTQIQKLSKFFSEMPFDCRTTKTHELAELILGKKIPFSKTDRSLSPAGKSLGEIPIFTAVVPLMEHEDHNYSLGSVAVGTGNNWDDMLRSDASYGNILDNGKNVSRPATPAEIDVFVNGLKEKTLDRLFEFEIIEKLMSRASSKPAKKKATKKKAK